MSQRLVQENPENLLLRGNLDRIVRIRADTAARRLYPDWCPAWYVDRDSLPKVTWPMVRRGILNRLLGDRGERAAAKYLKRCGYRILARQSRSRIGEIDLIALDGDTVVFVEVKTRSSLSAGHPTEAITAAKRKQLTRTALAWLKRRGLLESRSRFDVVAITWQEGGAPTIEHYKNAFEPVGEGQLYG